MILPCTVTDPELAHAAIHDLLPGDKLRVTGYLQLPHTPDEPMRMVVATLAVLQTAPLLSDPGTPATAVIERYGPYVCWLDADTPDVEVFTTTRDDGIDPAAALEVAEDESTALLGVEPVERGVHEGFAVSPRQGGGLGVGSRSGPWLRHGNDRCLRHCGRHSPAGYRRLGAGVQNRVLNRRTRLGDLAPSGRLRFLCRDGLLLFRVLDLRDPLGGLHLDLLGVDGVPDMRGDLAAEARTSLAAILQQVAAGLLEDA